MATLRPVRICFPVLALKVEGLFIDVREQPMSLVYQGGMSECWVDGGKMAVLLGGSEDFELHCMDWCGFLQAPPPHYIQIAEMHITTVVKVL
jgi:hypothetical protein